MSTTEFPTIAAPVTILERARDAVGCRTAISHSPSWSWVAQGSRFTWLMDGDRAVLLLDREKDSIELRCSGLHDGEPPDDLPQHYHAPTYVGVWLRYAIEPRCCGERHSHSVEAFMEGEVPLVVHQQRWTDGSIAESVARVRFEPAWGTYQVTIETRLRARHMAATLEFGNVLPAGISDTRPGAARHPNTYWSYRKGVRKMLKNPLWFCSTGAQDPIDEKHLYPGGFIGFGPDPHLNPVIEFLATESLIGAMTDEVTQAERLVLLPPGSRTIRATGWCEMSVSYRLFSVPEKLAGRLLGAAEDMVPGPMLAGKFRSRAIPVLPSNLSGIQLPGSPYFGPADWQVPIPWDGPFDGQMWMASPDPAADVYYCTDDGHPTDGSIRLAPAGDLLVVTPGSGHLRRIEANTTYLFTMWIRTEGRTEAWIECQETLYAPGDKARHRSESIGTDSPWTQVTTTVTGRGDDAPYAVTAICATGHGHAWFSGMSFVALPT